MGVVVSRYYLARMYVARMYLARMNPSKNYLAQVKHIAAVSPSHRD